MLPALMLRVYIPKHRLDMDTIGSRTYTRNMYSKVCIDLYFK
jgi:hypothetical protein